MEGLVPVAPKCVFQVHDSFASIAEEAAGKKLQNADKQTRWVRFENKWQECCVALCMATHPRLGALSPPALPLLDPD
eukprot:CAMPEP_0114110814 /NCGR_PEP_ID=MMETSP0043_2-20121206/1508_1 /TAXON_ID=464988 /ORGANISM="Hemiselmis andersenii, Strain CCMP644" /LENGTH=76 /DNA_ID=CAMNT_0001202779 /DNA_START=114 /DNA_END=341 /DNA_ORIENTATION=+